MHPSSLGVSGSAQLDHTHDAKRVSWVDCAHGHPDFPIQNLPLGVFALDPSDRIGCAIGNQVLDIPGAIDIGLLPQIDSQTRRALYGETLNGWMALSANQRRALRADLSNLLAADSRIGASALRHRSAILRPQSDCRMVLPAQVGDYTDYYAGIHHAYNCGILFRPELPLQPNYRHLPVAYHGRASSVQASGAPVHRPSGQVRLETADGPRAAFQPTARLDYEMELAIWIGPGNVLAHPIPIAQAIDHIAGFGLLNDWSARDIQTWESAPLGPFQSKNFMTSVSPWVITSDAMAPFRSARMERQCADPELLAYLHDDQDAACGGLSIELEVYLSTSRMRASGLQPHRLSRGSAAALWWTPAQMVTQHTSGGCNLRPGDLFGTGTISMPQGENCGCLLEMTQGGAKPVHLPGGEIRSFLQDGDEVLMRGMCHREGFASIGFGACKGEVRGSPQGATLV